MSLCMKRICGDNILLSVSFFELYRLDLHNYDYNHH